MNRPHTPEALFHAAVEALRVEDWLAVARLCDAESLEGFAAELRERHTRAPEPRHTAESIRAGNPELPLEVAEYYAAQSQKHDNPDHRLRTEFPSLRSVDELLELPADRVVAAWLHGQSLRVQIEAHVNEGLLAPDHARHALDAIEHMHVYDLLGVVMDGASVAHVIYRPALPPNPTVQDSQGNVILSPLLQDTAGRLYVKALACRKAPDGTWGIVAGYQMFDIGATAYAWSSSE